MNEICKIADCTSEVKYKSTGLCNMHYLRFRRTGKFTSDKLPPISPRKCKFCNVVFKPKHNRSKLFCSIECFRAWQKPKKCRIEDCNNICDTYNGGAHGYCCMHKARFIRYGDPLAGRKQRNPIFFDDGTTLGEGYARCIKNGKRIKRSRAIMSEHIGRELLSTEIVHHINFNKLDDRIENLEIVSRSEHNRIHNFAKSMRKRKKHFNTLSVL